LGQINLHIGFGYREKGIGGDAQNEERAFKNSDGVNACTRDDASKIRRGEVDATKEKSVKSNEFK